MKKKAQLAASLRIAGCSSVPDDDDEADDDAKKENRTMATKTDDKAWTGEQRPLKLSQHCGVTDQHGTCPRETTLGTHRCECPCHTEASQIAAAFADAAHGKRGTR